MKKTTPILILGLILIIIGGVVLFFFPKATENDLQMYTSETLGLQFLYLDTYFIAHESMVGGERNQYAIVLAEDTPENRAFFSDTPSATEAPPTITITVFQNNLDNYSTQSFFEGSNFSNSKLSYGNVANVLIGEEPALRYFATGLYENENVIVALPSFVYMFTAFFNAPSDDILVDFDTILKSVSFFPTEAEASANNIPTSADNAPPGSIHNLPLPPAVSAVRSLVARTLGISEGVVIVMSAYEREWSNGCLGLANADEFCTQAIVPGYEVSVQAQGKTLVYRTNADGTVIREDK